MPGTNPREFGHCLPLLITGITGVAGFSAFHYFQSKFPGRVIGIRSRQTSRLTAEGIIALEAEDRRSLGELFDRYRFRSVLNCAGNCALKACELDPDMAWQLNVAGAAAVEEQVRKHRARLVHLSTDLVFAGKASGDYSESDPVDPVTVYGKTMVEAEHVIRSSQPDAAILRLSLPMGPSFNKHAGAIDWIDSRFRMGKPATLYYDEVRSCTYTDDLNAVFEFFLAGNQGGLFHAGGPRPISLYQIAQTVNRVGGYAPDLLQGCLRRAAGPVPPRAGNVSMCSAKLISLVGHNPFRPWPAEPGLWPTCPDWHRTRRPDEIGSFNQIITRLYRASVTSPAA